MGFIASMMEKAGRFTLWDWAVLKAVLILLGIIIGAYVSKFVRKHIWYFAAAFIVLYGIIIYRLFVIK